MAPTVSGAVMAKQAVECFLFNPLYVTAERRGESGEKVGLLGDAHNAMSLSLSSASLLRLYLPEGGY